MSIFRLFSSQADLVNAILILLVFPSCLTGFLCLKFKSNQKSVLYPSMIFSAFSTFILFVQEYTQTNIGSFRSSTESHGEIDYSLIIQWFLFCLLISCFSVYVINKIKLQKKEI